jgi:hypothetical protein
MCYILCSIIVCILYDTKSNSYPMKEWHPENMKKAAAKYVTGSSCKLSPQS